MIIDQITSFPNYNGFGAGDLRSTLSEIASSAFGSVH
jgi:hypothetical protein